MFETFNRTASQKQNTTSRKGTMELKEGYILEKLLLNTWSGQKKIFRESKTTSTDDLR